MRLTEAGRLLHEHAVGIVEAVREAEAGLDALQAEQVKRLRLGGCPVAAGAVLPRALRLLRRRLPTADLLLEEATAEATREAVAGGRLEAGVWVCAASAAADPRIVETVLRRGPLRVVLAAGHPLARLEELDGEALAATPRIGAGPSLRTVLALAAAGEGYASCRRWRRSRRRRASRCAGWPVRRSGSCARGARRARCCRSGRSRRWTRCGA